MNSKSAGYPPVPLVYPQPAGFFPLGVFADGKKTSGSACIDTSRLIFQSAVSFQIRLVAKKQAGPTRLFFCIPAVKPSEFTERTLKGAWHNLLNFSNRSLTLSTLSTLPPHLQLRKFLNVYLKQNRLGTGKRGRIL